MGKFFRTLGVQAAALAAAAVVCLSSASPARAAVFTDNFDRGYDTDIGPNWTERAGNFYLVADRLRVASPAQSVMTVNGYAETAPTVSIDTIWPFPGIPGGAGNQIGLVSRYRDLDNFVNVKVYNAGTTSDGFDTLLFYYGNSTSAWPGMSGGGVAVAIPPFAAARLTTTVIGSTVTATIDTNSDGVPEYTHTRGGLPQDNLGTGVGVTMYIEGVAIDADNFSAVPEPSSVMVLSIAAAGLLARRRRVTR